MEGTRQFTLEVLPAFWAPVVAGPRLLRNGCLTGRERVMRRCFRVHCGCTDGAEQVPVGAQTLRMRPQEGFLFLRAQRRA